MMEPTGALDANRARPAKTEKRVRTILLAAVALFAGFLAYPFVQRCVFFEAIKQREDLAVSMVRWGVDPNIIDTNGTPALIVAVRLRRLHVVQALAKRGANIQAKDLPKPWDTAIGIAILRNDFDLVRILLYRDKKTADAIGVYFMVEAARFGNISGVTRFLDENFDINADESAGYQATMRLRGETEPRAFASPICGTALSLAAFSGKVAMVRLLLDRGANVNTRDRNGSTALQGAAFSGHVEIVHILLAKHPDLGARNSRGATALDIARTRGHAEIVKLLTAAGARN